MATAIGYSGGSFAYFPAFGVDIYPWGNFAIALYPIIMSYAMTRHRLMDIELMTREVIAKLLALALVAVPLLVGRVLAEGVLTLHGMGLLRSVTTLGACLVNFSLATMLLRLYEKPAANLLCRFLLLLGLWNTVEMVLVIPPQPWSVYYYRLGYGISCLVVVAWFEFWRSYFAPAEGFGPSRGFARLLRLSAYGMLAVSAFTPWVLNSLAFDSSHTRPAVEVPGAFLPGFAAWFLGALIAMTMWVGQLWWKMRQDKQTLPWPWVLAAYGLAGLAAAAYFSYVGRLIQVPIHCVLEILMSVALAAALLRRLQDAQSEKPVPLTLGAVALLVPFGTGFLLTQGAWGQVTAGLLLVVSVPRILAEVQDSVLAWVDRYVFNQKFHYLKEIRLISESLFRWTNLPELLKHLVQGLTERAQISWAGVWLYDLTGNCFGLRQAACREGRRREDLPLELWTVTFSQGNPLIRRLRGSSQMVLREDLEREEAPEALPGVPGDCEKRAIAGELARAQLAAALPIYHGGKLIGFLGFGPKAREQMFHQADVEGLSLLGAKAELAIGQAYLQYEQSLMLSKLAHDTLNFLHGQGLALEDLMREDKGTLNDYQKEQVAIIWSEKELIHESLEDLKELERLVVQRLEGKWRLAPYDLAAVVRGSISTYSAKAEGLGVRLETDFAHVPPALGDARAVRRAVDNLILNALKFTPRGGAVRFEIRPAGPDIGLAVADTGPGIPAAELPHVFDPFYQGPSRMSLAQGTGLGLAVVKEVVSLHKGEVRVESEPGKGTRFVLRLPTAERRQEFGRAALTEDFPQRKAA